SRKGMEEVVGGGTGGERRRREGDWLRLPAPDLRIVSDNLWHQVRARMATHHARLPRVASGRLVGRPSALDGESPYLLTGFTRCTCGGGPAGAPRTARARVGSRAP